jgi:hypothetical protein
VRCEPNEKSRERRERAGDIKNIKQLTTTLGSVTERWGREAKTTGHTHMRGPAVINACSKEYRTRLKEIAVVALQRGTVRNQGSFRGGAVINTVYRRQ